MTVQETSARAYYSINDLSNKECDVYRVIRDMGPVTNEEIAIELAWPINRVTGRTNSMVKKHLVREAGRKVGSTGRLAITWELNK